MCFFAFLIVAGSFVWWSNSWQLQLCLHGTIVREVRVCELSYQLPFFSWSFPVIKFFLSKSSELFFLWLYSLPSSSFLSLRCCQLQRHIQIVKFMQSRESLFPLLCCLRENGREMIGERFFMMVHWGSLIHSCKPHCCTRDILLCIKFVVVPLFPCLSKVIFVYNLSSYGWQTYLHVWQFLPSQFGRKEFFVAKITHDVHFLKTRIHYRCSGCSFRDNIIRNFTGTLNCNMSRSCVRVLKCLLETNVSIRSVDTYR